MSLKETLVTDMKIAMREKDSHRLEVVRMLRAAVQRKEVDDQKELTEDETLAIVQKMIKQAQDSIKQFNEGDRADLAEKEQSQLEVMMTYMPKQLDDAAIDAAVEKAIATTGASEMKDMGKVMGILKAELSGKADMGKVSGKIKAKLT